MSRSPNNLPAQLTSFIGREDEVADFARRLTGTRLLTLTGPGGAGKTRLAVEAARRFDAGQVWFVDLSPIVDAKRVPSAIAAAAGIAEVQGESPLEALASALRSVRALLILDNCEHLIVACSAAVESLLRNCPSVTVLATSREPLNVPGEVVRRVQSLSPGEAIALFVERATAAEPGFVPGPEGGGPIDSLCEQLDGLPLAIELAAACVKVLTVPEIAARLGERLDLLSSRGTTVTVRHLTLRALVDWSYNLLLPGEQQLYRRLSVFAGGCTLDAVAGICEDDFRSDGELLQLLRALVEKSLVIAEQHDGKTRYRMLETLRQHSREKLRKSGEERDLQRRHLEWFRELAEQLGGSIGTPSQDSRGGSLLADIENLRAALVWSRIDAALHAEGLALATALENFWYGTGNSGEGRDWILTLLTGAPPDNRRAKALAAASFLAMRRGDQDAEELSDGALALARDLGDASLIVTALRNQGQVRTGKGDLDGALAALVEALELVKIHALSFRTQTLLNAMGLLLARRGDTEGALAYLHQALQRARDQHDVRFVGPVLRNLGSVHLNLGDTKAAWAYLEESLGPSMPVSIMETTRVLANIAGLAAAESQMRRAIRLAGAAAGLRAASRERLEPGVVAWLERRLEPAYQALDPVSAQAAWDEGAAMSLDEAVRYALDRGSEGSEAWPSPKPERPGGLTPRELEVVVLLARGLSNHEIAQALVVSDGTAKVHVEHILNKLGMRSRAEIAAWATRAGLADASAGT